MMYAFPMLFQLHAATRTSSSCTGLMLVHSWERMRARPFMQTRPFIAHSCVMSASRNLPSLRATSDKRAAQSALQSSCSRQFQSFLFGHYKEAQRQALHPTRLLFFYQSSQVWEWD